MLDTNHRQPNCCHLRRLCCTLPAPQGQSAVLRASSSPLLVHPSSSIQLVWDRLSRAKRGTGQREGRLTETWKSSPKKDWKISSKEKEKIIRRQNLKWIFGTWTPDVKGSHDGNMKTVVQQRTEKQLRWFWLRCACLAWLIFFSSCLNIYPSVCVSVSLSVYLSSICLTACLLICPCVCLCVSV